MFKKIICILAVLIFAVAPLAGCSGNQEEGVINENGGLNDPSASPGAEGGEEGGSGQDRGNVKKNKEKYPTYDINAVEQSVTPPTFKQKDSYFKSQLDEKSLVVYSEIKSAYNKYQNEVVLTKTIPEKDLFRIMAIMYIDDPAMYMMKAQYDYFLDANKYVYKIRLYYSMDKMSYKTYKEKIDQTALEIYQEITSSYETDPEKAVVKDTEEGGETNLITEEKTVNIIRSDCGADVLQEEKSNDNTIQGMSVVTEAMPKVNSFSYAKYMTYLLRYMGMDAAVVIGKPTNETYQGLLTRPSACGLESYEDAARIRHKKGKSKYSVSYDFNDFCAWYIVKINDKWYHCDDYYNSLIESKNDVIAETISETPLTVFASDYLIAESRFFYQSDKILGDMPLCTSSQFLPSYRKGIYLLDFTEEQTITYITDVTNILKSNEVQKLVYQFETEEGYQYFTQHFDEIVKSHNENSKDIIADYKMIKIPEALTVVINGFVYK